MFSRTRPDRTIVYNHEVRKLKLMLGYIRVLVLFLAHGLDVPVLDMLDLDLTLFPPQ
jgi:hypothetical protein